MGPFPRDKNIQPPEDSLKAECPATQPNHPTTGSSEMMPRSLQSRLLIDEDEEPPPSAVCDESHALIEVHIQEGEDYFFELQVEKLGNRYQNNSSSEKSGTFQISGPSSDLGLLADGAECLASQNSFTGPGQFALPPDHSAEWEESSTQPWSFQAAPWKDEMESAPGSVATRREESMSTSEIKTKIVESYRCETVLLNFARELRKHLHNTKNNCIRMHVWSDCVALQKESVRRSQGLCISERKAVAKIDRSLPFDCMLGKLPGDHSPSRKLRLATTARQWRPADSKRLLSVVGDLLLSAYTEYTSRVEKLNNPLSDLEVFKQGVVEKARLEQAEDEGKWKVSTFDRLNDVLDELKVRAPKPDYEIFWQSFWDRVSVECSVRGSKAYKSGRECQIHWVHFLHPSSKEGQLWTKEEESALLQAVDELGGQRWEEVASRIGTGRSVFDTYKHYQTALNVNLTTGGWTEAEMTQLQSLCAKYLSESVVRRDELNLTVLVAQPRVYLWSKVASHFPNKSNDQCRLKYEAQMRTPAKHGRWTLEEDLRLQVLVAHYGRGFWLRVAKGMPFRTDAKCRERYENVLAPDLVKSKWSEAENRKLLEAVTEFGAGNWSKVKTMMPGRTDFDCAKQWARLDPVGMINLEGVRTVKSMFFPKYTRVRGIRPSLTSDDFKVSITGEFKTLWQRTTEIDSHPTRSLPTPSAEDRENIAERLEVLRYFVNSLSVSLPRSNNQLERMAKAIIRRREHAYGIKLGDPVLRSDYKTIVDQIIEEEICVADFDSQPQNNGLYFPNNAKFESPNAQRVLKLISDELKMKASDVVRPPPEQELNSRNESVFHSKRRRRN